MFEPVKLQARNSRGKKLPYLNLRWLDGIFMLGMMKGTALTCLDLSDRLIAKYFSKSSSVGLAHKLLRDMLAQTYVGDISILPQRRLISPVRVISPNTGKENSGLLLDGERQTWPRIEMIRLSSKISRTLDEILRRRKTR